MLLNNYPEDVVIYSYEEYFHLSGIKKTLRYLSENNYEELRHRQFHSTKVAAWWVLFLILLLLVCTFLEENGESYSKQLSVLLCHALWLPIAKKWKTVQWPWECVVPTKWYNSPNKTSILMAMKREMFPGHVTNMDIVTRSLCGDIECHHVLQV